MLDEIDQLIDFSFFVDGFEASSSALPQGGRPAYPPLLIFKALLIQTLYNLSDEKIDEALTDRLSFKRFCGFAVEDVTPDKTTICHFRNSLQGFDENFLDMVNEQLDQHGHCELDSSQASYDAQCTERNGKIACKGNCTAFNYVTPLGDGCSNK